MTDCRSSRLIALDLLIARKRVQALAVQLVEARMDERDRIVELAAQGHTLKEIARAMGMSRGATQGILFRAGKSLSGKRRVRTPRVRASALSAMLDANLSAALRHRAPQQVSADGAS